MGFRFEKYKKAIIQRGDISGISPSKELTLESKIILKRLGYKIKDGGHSYGSKHARLRHINRKNRGANHQPKQSARFGKQ